MRDVSTTVAVTSMPERSTRARVTSVETSGKVSTTSDHHDEEQPAGPRAVQGSLMLTPPSRTPRRRTSKVSAVTSGLMASRILGLPRPCPIVTLTKNVVPPVAEPNECASQRAGWAGSSMVTVAPVAVDPLADGPEVAVGGGEQRRAADGVDGVGAAARRSGVAVSWNSATASAPVPSTSMPGVHSSGAIRSMAISSQRSWDQRSTTPVSSSTGRVSTWSP